LDETQDQVPHVERLLTHVAFVVVM
jgi:hypothetical protein